MGREEGMGGVIQGGIALGKEAAIAEINTQAIDDGIPEGIQEGIEEGIEEGIQEGIEEGAEEGIH